MTETNGRIEILRAAGFGEAADLLERLDAIDHTPAAGEADQPRPTVERQPTPAEAQREAEGQVMLAALRRDIPDIFDR